MADFEWTAKKNAVAAALAEGYTQAEVMAQTGVSDRTIRRWLTDAEFSEEVDNLSLMVGIAHRASRLRIVQRVVRARTKKDGGIDTDKDVLDWLKYAQSETEGINLNLDQAFRAATSSLAGSEQAEDGERSGGETSGA